MLDAPCSPSEDALTEVRLVVPAAHLDAAEAFLEASGALCLSRGDAEDVPQLEPAPGADVRWPLTVLTAHFHPDPAFNPEAVCAHLKSMLPADTPIHHAQIVSQDWIHAWREHVQPVHFGNRLSIVPETPTTTPEHPTVCLVPGLGFGTGMHPTTQLCLAYLAEHLPPATRVLDLGCGSGILGLAALKLGASDVLAVDNDPQACQSTRTNAANNAIDSQHFTCCLSDAMPAMWPADWVVANILHNTLIDLEPLFDRHLKANGQLVLSGLYGDQPQSLLEAYGPSWVAIHQAQQDTWSLLVLQKALLS